MLGLKRKPSNGTSDVTDNEKLKPTNSQEIVNRTLQFLSMLEENPIQDDVLFKDTSYVNGWMIIKSYHDKTGFFNVGRAYALKDHAEFPMHVHEDMTECLFWISGEMTVEVDNKKHVLNKTTRVVCVLPGQVHNIVAIQEGSMLIYIDVPEEKEL